MGEPMALRWKPCLWSSDFSSATCRSVRSRMLVLRSDRNSMWRTPQLLRTSICVCGLGSISSANALMRNMRLTSARWIVANPRKCWVNHAVRSWSRGRPRKHGTQTSFCALILGNDRQFGFVHQEGPLAGRGEANFDLAQRAVAAHLRDLSSAVAVVADEHAFGVARRGAARRRLGDRGALA